MCICAACVALGWLSRAGLGWNSVGGHPQNSLASMGAVGICARGTSSAQHSSWQHSTARSISARPRTPQNGMARQGTAVKLQSKTAQSPAWEKYASPQTKY